MAAHASSVFDRRVAQALDEAAPLMASMCEAALRAPLEPEAHIWLRDRRDALPAGFASRLKLAVGLATSGSWDQQQALLDAARLPAGNREWKLAVQRLRQRTAQGLAALEAACQPLRKGTDGWRHGNPLHHDIYLDTLSSTLLDQGLLAGRMPMLLGSMVDVLGEYLAHAYAAIADQMRAADVQQVRRTAQGRSFAGSFARRVRPFFFIPRDCPVGAVKAYKQLLPVMERLAVAEPDFFTDQGHPARRLAQAIVDQSVILKRKADVEAFPVFSARVNASLDRLGSLAAPTGADFAQELLQYGMDLPQLDEREAEPAGEWSGSGWSSLLNADEGSQFPPSHPAPLAVASAPAPVPLPAPVANARPPVPQPATQQQGWSLEPGMVLEFLSQGQWHPRQLSWLNPQRTMFLFTGADGSSQSITRRMLERLARERAIRLG